MGDLDVSVDPLLAPTEQDTKTTTSSSGGHVMSAASKAAIDAEHKANVAVADAQRAVGEAQSVQDAVKADQLAQASDLAHQQAADQAAEHQAQVDRIEAARAAQAQAEDAFANHTFHDYWSHQSVGKRIAAGFGLFAGGTGAGLVGGENPAATALYRDMDKDFAKQTAQVNQLRDVAKMKGQYVNDLGVQEGHENAALAIKFAKANEATAAEMVQRLAESGIPLDQAKNNTVVQGLLARAEEKRREALQHYDRTYQAATTKKEVTGEGKANIAAQRLALQKQKLTLRDPETGDEMGMEPTGEAVSHDADKMAKLATYRDLALKVADDIEQNGRLKNPFSDAYKERESNIANLRSVGRAVKEIQSSNAGAELEHQVVGGSGLGLSRMAPPEMLRRLAAEADLQVKRGLKAKLTPMPGQTQSRSPSTGAEGETDVAPKTPTAGGVKIPGGATLVKVRSKKTGALVDAMKLADGRLVAVQ